MAEQEEPVRRKVALKVIKLGMDTRQVVARFEAERQTLALMDHPNIAKVLEAGATDTGRPYFVMELVGGVKITDYCDQNQLDTRQHLDLFIQVCRAVQHAHQKGVIHRDIKPSNVLVATQDGVPVPKVIDFGISKATQGKLTDQTVFTAFEQFLGTPAYMSPEQAELGGLDIDTRSDIYSLGVLLYELLTGKTPFDAKELLASGVEAMRRTIQEKEPPTPSIRLKQETAARSDGSAKSEIPSPKFEIDRDLDWIVMKCLEKDRARRYETANGLARDIERHLQNQPVLARPPSKLYRFQKLVRRNKVTAAAVAVIAAVLVLGVVTSAWQAWRATRAEREQTRLREAAEKAQANEARLRHQAEIVPDLLFLGKEFVARNEWAKAELVCRQALAQARELYGNDHLQVAFTLWYLGFIFERQDDPAKAEPYYREALAVSVRLLGSKDARVVDMLLDPSYRLSVIDLLETSASVLDKQSKQAEAETLYRDTLGIWRKMFGDKHSREAWLLQDFALVFERHGKLAEAAATHREAAASGESGVLSRFAWFLSTCPDPRFRDGSSALTFAERAVEATKRLDPDALNALAAAYAEVGQFARAVSVQQEAIPLVQDEERKKNYVNRLKVYEASTPYRDRYILGLLTSAKLREREFNEAEALARECLRLREKETPDDWETFNARAMLGGSLVGQKKYAEAEPLLISGYKGMKEHEDTTRVMGKPRMKETLQSLVILCEVTGRAEQAVKWKAELGKFSPAQTNQQ